MRRQIPGIILFCLAVWMCVLTYMVKFHPDWFLTTENPPPVSTPPVTSQSGDNPLTSDGSDPLQEPKGELVQEEASTTTILVAARNLKWEEIHKIGEGMLEHNPTPTHLLPDGYIHENELLGCYRPSFNGGSQGGCTITAISDTSRSSTVNRRPNAPQPAGHGGQSR